MGVPDIEIQRLSLESLKNKDISVILEEREKKNAKIEFDEVTLPTTVEQLSEKHGQMYLDYLTLRHISRWDYPFMIDTEQKRPGIVIPYTYRHKIVGYTTRFLSLGTKATNMYANVSVVAFTANLFTHPFIDQLLMKRNVVVDAQKFALSEMIQWIYRSRIRNGESIVVYVPSKRMRNLLERWLNGEFD